MADDNELPSAETDTPLAEDCSPCVGCGMCCDGTMFAKAKARADERQRLEAAGLVCLKVEDTDWFELPCRFSQEGLCTIYGQQRFNVCRKYKCVTLEAYQSGQINRDEAFGRVEQALAMRSAIEAEEPAAGKLRGRRELRLELGRSKQRPALQLKMLALDHYLDRFFRHDPVNVTSGAEPRD